MQHEMGSAGLAGASAGKTGGPPGQISSPGAMADTVFRGPHGEHRQVRAVGLGDGPALAAFYRGLDRQTLRRRFHSGLRTLPESWLQGLCDVRAAQAPGTRWLVALQAAGGRSAWPSRGGDGGESPASQIIGWAGWYRAPGLDVGEFALVVADACQHQGVGTRLMAGLVRSARAEGLAWLTADVMADNPAMLALAHRMGLWCGPAELADACDGVLPLAGRVALLAQALERAAASTAPAPDAARSRSGLAAAAGRFGWLSALLRALELRR